MQYKQTQVHTLVYKCFIKNASGVIHFEILLYMNVELESSLGLKKLHLYFEMFVATVECRKNKNYF